MNNQVKVSILVAARNEEATILRLLESLNALNWPKNNLEILIGNDDSSDSTADIVCEFIMDKPHYQLLLINKNLGSLKGKTNVLAQLANKATGDFYFFTDADIEVPPTWIEEMLKGFDTKKGVVIGTTLTKPLSLFARCQGIEWLTVLKLMNTLNKFNIPTTGMGNNMVVTKEAYWATGGYESIPFSIVEDYALYKAVIANGYGFNHLYHQGIMTTTLPPENFFEQRKRWISGGLTSKSFLLIPALFQATTLPLSIILFLINWQSGTSILLSSFFINLLLACFSLYSIKLYKWLIYTPLYTCYVLIFWFLQLVYFVLPTRLVWKGRSYD